MKANLFKKAIYLMAVIGLISLSASSAFSQQVKKKIVRVIEVDDKGERVLKEYNVTNDAAKFDSIKHDVRKKIQVERIKMDSLEHIMMISLPNHSSFPPVPDVPDFDFGADMPGVSYFDSDSEFEFFSPESLGNSAKVYYSEKNFDKSVDLSKILEDLESGKFDPQKWNMKEVDKDQIKDFKAKGKGEVIVFGNRTIAPPHIRNFSSHPYRKVVKVRGNRDEARGERNGHRMIYITKDSLDKKNLETYTVESSGDSEGDLYEKVTIISPDGDEKEKIFWQGDGSGPKRIKGHRMVIYSNDSIEGSNDKDKMKWYTVESSDETDEPNLEKVIVVTSDGNKHNITMNMRSDGKNEKKRIFLVNNGKTIDFVFTEPSDDEMKELEKSDLTKEDKTKRLSPESLMLVPTKETDKYTIQFNEKEKGSVKFIITNDKGKAIKTDLFEHAKGKTEKEVEIKDLKAGVYFIQAQLNGKTTTSKLEIKRD